MPLPDLFIQTGVRKLKGPQSFCLFLLNLSNLRNLWFLLSLIILSFFVLQLCLARSYNLHIKLIQVGIILGIEVIEHLVITLNSDLSFVDTGLLKKLAESTGYVPTYALVKRIKKEEKKIREAAVKVAKEKGIKR